MHQLCFLYMLNYPGKSTYSLSTHCPKERERAAAHMQGTVFTLARSKIVSTIKNLYHIQCQCVDKLNSLV